MAYLLEVDVTAVAPYLFDLELSREGRLILARVLNEIRVDADHFRNEPNRRLFPDSDCFRVDFVFRDPSSSTLHHLHLIFSDAAAHYGILRVVFAEDVV